MKINSTFETEEGTIRFQGELNSEELDLVIGIGLNLLFQQGLLPMASADEEDLASFHKGSKELN